MGVLLVSAEKTDDHESELDRYQVLRFSPSAQRTLTLRSKARTPYLRRKERFFARNIFLPCGFL